MTNKYDETKHDETFRQHEKMQYFYTYYIMSNRYLLVFYQHSLPKRSQIT